MDWQGVSNDEGSRLFSEPRGGGRGSRRGSFRGNASRRSPSSEEREYMSASERFKDCLARARANKQEQMLSNLAALEESHREKTGATAREERFNRRQNHQGTQRQNEGLAGIEEVPSEEEEERAAARGTRITPTPNSRR